MNKIELGQKKKSEISRDAFYLLIFISNVHINVVQYVYSYAFLKMKFKRNEVL